MHTHFDFSKWSLPTPIFKMDHRSTKLLLFSSSHPLISFSNVELHSDSGMKLHYVRIRVWVHYRWALCNGVQRSGYTLSRITHVSCHVVGGWLILLENQQTSLNEICRLNWKIFLVLALSWTLFVLLTQHRVVSVSFSLASHRKSFGTNTVYWMTICL